MSIQLYYRDDNNGRIIKGLSENEMKQFIEQLIPIKKGDNDISQIVNLLNEFKNGLISELRKIEQTQTDIQIKNVLSLIEMFHITQNKNLLESLPLYILNNFIEIENRLMTSITENQRELKRLIYNLRQEQYQTVANQIRTLINIINSIIDNFVCDIKFTYWFESDLINFSTRISSHCDQLLTIVRDLYQDCFRLTGVSYLKPEDIALYFLSKQQIDDIINLDKLNPDTNVLCDIFNINLQELKVTLFNSYKNSDYDSIKRGDSFTQNHNIVKLFNSVIASHSKLESLLRLLELLKDKNNKIRPENLFTMINSRENTPKLISSNKN